MGWQGRPWYLWALASGVDAGSNGIMSASLQREPSAPVPRRSSTILVVDDEPGILEVLSLGLRSEDLVVLTARDVAGGLEAVRLSSPDLIVLDVGLPGGDGFSLLSRIREVSDVPIVMLTARHDVEDRVRGLELGADDYIAKPFHLEELVARIRAQLRRRARDRDKRASSPVLRSGEMTVDFAGRRASRGSRELELTAREFDLFELFVRHPGQVLSKTRILEELWGYAYDPNLVEVYIGYLRRKLGDPPVLETVRGSGYRLASGHRAPEVPHDGA
jgi:two-component system, OmpR family, response regulator MprA